MYGVSRAGAFDGKLGGVVVLEDEYEDLNCCITRYVRTRTWLWRGGVWTDLNPRREPALSPAYGDPWCLFEVPPCPGDPTEFEPQLPLTRGSAAAYDPARSEVVLVTALGTTWTFNGVNWRPAPAINPPMSVLHAPSLAYDPVRRQVLMYGSGDLRGCLVPTLGIDCNWTNANRGTWRWTGLAWLPVASTDLAAAYGVIEFFPPLRSMILFGPGKALPGVPSDSTWRLAE